VDHSIRSSYAGLFDLLIQLPVRFAVALGFLIEPLAESAAGGS
jgi:hypothetical protein